MRANRLQGTPWHEERVHRKEGDDRRHKSRCKYYLESDGKCRKQLSKCIGSGHCDDYIELSDEELKARRKPKKKIGEDDCYWYT